MAVAEKVRKSLNGWATWGNGKSTSSVASLNLPGRSPQQLAALAENHPSYYALGAVGPDLFFFLPDFRSKCVRGNPPLTSKRVPLANTLIGITEWLDNFYEKLDKWILEDWERYFGPGNENTAEAMSRLTGDLNTVVVDITAGFASIGTTALLALASQAYDWVGLFSLGLNKGYDNQDFFWSDMLHYRKTSRFGRSLWTLAEDKEKSGQPTTEEAKVIADRLRAYALGYITHLATDTTGHPFVNEKSGGPFRTHWQRHHLIENHMDAQTFDDDYGGKDIYNMFTESALHYRVAFAGNGDDNRKLFYPYVPGDDYYRKLLPPYTPGDDSLQALYVLRRQLDLDSEMPSELADLLFDAMGQTYQTGASPSPNPPPYSTPRIIMDGDGRPDAEMIKTAYLLMFRYLKLSTLDGFKHDKPEPPELFPNWQPPLLTDPHDGPPTAFIGPSNAVIDTDSVKHLVLSIIRFMRWLAAAALWVATIIPTLMADAATYIPRLIAYYSIELPLYYMVKAERRIMVMSGFMHPMRDEIDDGLVRLCRGHDDSFLSMLKAMNDSLGGVDDNGLTSINTQALKLMNILDISASEAVAQALGTNDLSSTHPGEPLPDKNYPHAQPLDAPDGKPIEYHAPWRYPDSPPELNPTFAGPYTCGDTPHILLDGGIPGDQSIRKEYEESASPIQTDDISFTKATKTVNLGDPVNFSEYLIWQLTRDTFPLPMNSKTQITDWNLDADRGYAYKCWDWNRSDHVLQDLEGNEYLEPCTAPPQSEKPDDKNPCAPPPTKKHEPNVPLLIHYTDQKDPGC
jgi:hypothetical protein